MVDTRVGNDVSGAEEQSVVTSGLKSGVAWEKEPIKRTSALINQHPANIVTVRGRIYHPGDVYGHVSCAIVIIHLFTKTLWGYGTAYSMWRHGWIIGVCGVEFYK